MSKNAGKTVREILLRKIASIKRPPLDEGSPSWDDILDFTWEEILKRAKARKTGFRTFRKLLTDGDYDK